MNTTPISPRVSNAAASSRRWRDLVLLGGLVLLVVVGLVGLAAATGWEETMAALGRLSLGEFILLLLLSLTNYVGRGMRWHLFAGQLGLGIGFWQNMRHFLGGFAMSVTSGRVGELVRMRWIRRETGWSFERTAPLVLVDRAADMSAMAVLLALALAFAATGLKGGTPVAILALIAAFAVTRPKLLKSLSDTAYRLTGKRMPRLFARIRRAAKSLEAFTHPSTLVLASIFGIAGWFAEGYAFYLLLNWMGADVDLWSAVGIFVLATLVGGATGAPGGLGGAEAVMVALLAVQNVPLEIAVAATLIIRVTTLWFAIAIGLAIFPFAERHSRKAENALER